MEKISAWVYDPTKSLFGDKSGNAALYEISCQNPQGCDLYTKNNSCILSGSLSGCKFGRKCCTNGPTKRARGFHSWMSDRRKENSEWIGNLDSNTAYNRIFKIQDHYYLPYSFMAEEYKDCGNPLPSKWVNMNDMTADLLERICNARPRALFGGVISGYQTEQVPKFLTDLRMFYPGLFDLLPEDQKARARSLSNVGRLADITTCLPGPYVFSRDKWDWDGQKLTGRSMLFQPVKGEIEITIVPEKGQGVKITDDAQVGPETMFLD
jgi:hypothetical protein